jgi:hypothetical protein
MRYACDRNGKIGLGGLSLSPLSHWVKAQPVACEYYTRPKKELLESNHIQVE